MSYTQEQVDALKAAVAAGIRTVQTDGHMVTYASAAEMLRTISVMERDIAARAASTSARHTNPTYSRGV